MRELILNRIEFFSKGESGPFNAFRLWQEKPVYWQRPGIYFGWTRANFEALDDKSLLEHFEHIVHMAYRQMG